MRYLVLVLLNIPVVILALLNIVTKFKLGKITLQRYRSQMFLWISITIVVAGSFPLYNYLSNNPIFASNTLTFLDIVQTTAIIFLIYSLGTQHSRLVWLEKRTRDLHQELSIQLSEMTDEKNTRR